MTNVVNKSITCIAPSKTFNIAGLQSSMIFTKQDYYEKLTQQLTTDFFSGTNVFGIYGPNSRI